MAPYHLDALLTLHDLNRSMGENAAAGEEGGGPADVQLQGHEWRGSCLTKSSPAGLVVSTL